MKPPPATWFKEVGGDKTEAFYLWHGLANSTRKSYDKAPKDFADFCRSRGYKKPFFPAQSDRVGPWIASEAKKLVQRNGSLSAKTLKRRIAALKSYHSDLGFSEAGIINTRVERVIQGANRWHGITRKEQPLPITLTILRKLVAYIRRNPTSFGGRQSANTFVAVFTLAFACFLRLGEVTYTSFDGRFDLKWSNIHLPTDNSEVATIELPASKTDPFRKGVTVVIPSGPADVCPVRALRIMRQGVADRGGPLFQIRGLAFSRPRAIKALNMALVNSGYQAHRYSGHSFRRGAATWAASIGMSSTEIKTLGRWNSDCFQLYVDAGPPSHAKAGAKLLRATAGDSSLPASGIPQPGTVWRPALA